MEKQDRLTDMMSRAGQVAPPDNFTQAVVARLKREENASTLKKILLEPHYASLEMNTILYGALSLQGRIYLILLTGLFYLVAGLILALGQRWMPDMYLNEWIRNQAFMAFLSTGFFLFIWVNLKRDKVKVWFIRISSILYISVLIMNFMFTNRLFTLPVSVVLSLFLMGLGLLATCLLIFDSAGAENEIELPAVPGN
jgi:hypothetical protein